VLPTRIFHKPHYLYRPSQAIRRLAYRPGAWSPTQTVVTTLPWGAQLECWPADLIGSAIMRAGIYDLLTTEAIFRLTEPGDFAVDVGANVGQMTSALAQAAGPSGRVVAFEPHAGVHAALRRNVARWHGDRVAAAVDLHAAAASDEAGTVMLVSGVDFAANRGTSQVDTSRDVRGAGARHDVPAVRLDEVVTRPVGVLKLDCEGHERAALAGATGLLERGMIRDVVFEEFDRYPTPVTDLLEAAGLEVMALGERLAGPEVLAPTIARSPSWDPPVLVASRDPERLRERMRRRGWRALRRRRIGPRR
jgi:FkbM family methyltransferase